MKTITSPNLQAGFEELAHTADVALRVWGNSPSEFFRQAVLGMYFVIGIQLATEKPITKIIRLADIDLESLLVSFLNELLFLIEKGFAFDQMDIQITDITLEATLSGSKIGGQQKEIKAVTYNDLTIKTKGDILQAIIVFDI